MTNKHNKLSIYNFRDTIHVMIRMIQTSQNILFMDLTYL